MYNYILTFSLSPHTEMLSYALFWMVCVPVVIEISVSRCSAQTVVRDWDHCTSQWMKRLRVSISSTLSTCLRASGSLRQCASSMLMWDTVDSTMLSHRRWVGVACLCGSEKMHSVLVFITYAIDYQFKCFSKKPNLIIFGQLSVKEIVMAHVF